MSLTVALRFESRNISSKLFEGAIAQCVSDKSTVHVQLTEDTSEGLGPYTHFSYTGAGCVLFLG